MLAKLVCMSGLLMGAFVLIWAPISLVCLAPAANFVIRRQNEWEDAVVGIILFSGGWASIIYVVRAWTSQCF